VRRPAWFGPLRSVVRQAFFPAFVDAEGEIYSAGSDTLGSASEVSGPCRALFLLGLHLFAFSFAAPRMAHQIGNAIWETLRGLHFSARLADLF
jgi:hypothetical protein